MINDELGLCGMRFSLPMLHTDNPAGLLIVGHGVVPNRLGILADAPPALARTLDRCRPLRLLAAILRAVPKSDPPAALIELLDAPLIHTVWVNGSVLWPKYSLDPADELLSLSLRLLPPPNDLAREVRVIESLGPGGRPASPPVVPDWVNLNFKGKQFALLKLLVSEGRPCHIKREVWPAVYTAGQRFNLNTLMSVKRKVNEKLLVLSPKLGTVHEVRQRDGCFSLVRVAGTKTQFK
jgi:hypothetical protein